MILTELSIKRPAFSWVLSLILVLFGSFVFWKLPVRELPSGLQPPVVQVNVEYASASSQIIDEEVTHITEDVHFLAIEGTGTLPGSTYIDPDNDPDPVSTIAQVGQITNLDENNQTIVLDHDFDNPVIFANPLSYNGPAPAIARVPAIQRDRFSVELQEPRNDDGTHAEDTCSF